MQPNGAIAPRPPARLFEWVAAFIMLGYLLWPLATGHPLHSSGHEYMREAGVSLQHVAIALGFCGMLRLYVLWHHGRFYGLCPWVRAGCAALGAVVWTELLVSLAFYSAAASITSSGMPNYAGLLIGELITLHRAVRDGFDLRAAKH
jgi:hypothetical protein